MEKHKNFPASEGEDIYTLKAQDLVSKMTLAEKVDLMGGKAARSKIHGALKGTLRTHYNEHPYQAGGCARLGVPEMKFCDGPRGVVCGVGKATCFTAPVMRAAAFDRELEEQIGEAIAEEAIASGANFFGGVCINVPYHPGWGRSQETYGEDTFLIGSLGSALAEGMEKRGVIACAKHFAFNSMENLRFDVNVTCSKKTEREIFLRQFQKVSRVCGAIMTAYNKYRGEYCGQNGYLISKVLFGEWGFDGFTISDFTWGIRDTIAAANAGMDVEMADTRLFGQRLIEAVRSGNVPEDVIDLAAVRIASTLLLHEAILEGKISGATGTPGAGRISRAAENSGSARSFGAGKTPAASGILRQPSRYLASPPHRALAKTCAQEGITLLKNDQGFLPLDRKSIRRLAVIGRLADQDNTGDHGSARVYPPYVTSILDGLHSHCSAKTEIVYYRGHNAAHARRLAWSADAVIVVAGYDYRDEGEAISKDEHSTTTGTFAGGDRTGKLRLKEEEEEMILAACQGNPNTTVVLIAGSTVIPGNWLCEAGALLYYYYGGMEGGNALADIIFGDVCPSGHLPFVIPESEEDLPKLDFSEKEVVYGYYHGYRKLFHEGKKALFPFGFGLSYTEFCIEGLKTEFTEDKGSMRLSDAACIVNGPGVKPLEKEGNLEIRLLLKNTGSREGAAVLQIYVQSPEGGDVPTLRAYERVFLQEGGSREITIHIAGEDLSMFSEKEDRFLLLPGEYRIYAGFHAPDPGENYHFVQI